MDQSESLLPQNTVRQENGASSPEISPTATATDGTKRINGATRSSESQSAKGEQTDIKNIRKLIKLTKRIEILFATAAYAYQLYGTYFPFHECFVMMGSDFGFAFPIAFIVLSLLWGIFAALLLILNYYYCCKNKKTSVWYEFSDMIVDGVYLSANFVLILIILLNEYCFAPNQGRPGDLEIFSPFQTYVLHPAIYMLLSTLKYIWDNVFPLCSSAELKIRPGRVKRSSIRVVLIIFGLMFSTGMFLLKYDGYCCLELLNRPCKPIEYEIKAESCTLTIVTSSVKSPDNFEDSHLIVKYCYKSLLSDDLHNMLSYPEYSIQHVAAKNWSSVDENNFSSHDVWNKAQPKPLLINENVKRLNAKSGLTFLFPCANVNYLQTIRPNVTCFLRIQSQYSSGPSLQISYKTDVIFKYPESVEKNAQWERRDNFSSIFSATSRESLQALKVSFEHIDQQIAKMDFSEDVPQGGDLFSEKPKLVEISCLNSCFCYDCYFQDNKTLPANCTDVCRHVDWNFFGKSDREAFCSDDDSNRCDYKYVPVSEAEKLLNLPRNKLLSHLKPIEIKVNFGNRTENPSIQNAVYDPNMSMPAPESSFEDKHQNKPSCGYLIYVLLSVGAIFVAIIVFLIVVMCKTEKRAKKERQQRRQRRHHNTKTEDDIEMVEKKLSTELTTDSVVFQNLESPAAPNDVASG